MPRYIDAENLDIEISSRMYGDSESIRNLVIDEIRDIISEAPAADVEAVKHGHWITGDASPHHVYCSNCFKSIVTEESIIEKYDIPTKFCPKCGARMDGK